MTKYLLVAIRHEVAPLSSHHKQIMSEACAARLTAMVVPFITDRSLILSEGLDFAFPLSPGHREYDYEKSWIFGDQLTSAQPMLGGCDFRQRKWNIASARYERWTTIIRELYATTPMYAQSVPQMIETLGGEAEKSVAEFVYPPSSEEIEVARWMDATNRKFDRLYLEAMQKRARRHDLCIFIGGAAHAISMALKSGYPVIDLTSSATDPIESWGTLTGYLANYVWPQFYLQQK